MSYEEKGIWVYLVVTIAAYLGFLIVVLGRAASPITETAYQMPLLVAVGAAVVAAVIVRVTVEIVKPSDSYQIDGRDRELAQLGVLRSWWLVVAGALAALIMAMLQWPHFWIANVLYLGFVLQAVTSSVVSVVGYRRGF